jgi:uncharacterized membrane protein YfcA
MLQYRLYGGNDLPAGLQGLLKAAANIGSVIGQFLFGQLKDQLHRALFLIFLLRLSGRFVRQKGDLYVSLYRIRLVSLF